MDGDPGEVHGYIPTVYQNGNIRPWQQDYFAGITIAAARHGNADALTFLKWQENFLIGRFLNDAQGFNSRDGVAYVLAQGDEAAGRVFTTWAEMGANTVARGWSNLDGWEASGGDYAQLGLATLAGIYDLTGNPAAKAAYEALMAKAPPYTLEADFANGPGWAIAAPGSVPRTQLQETSTLHVKTTPIPTTPGDVAGKVPLSIVLSADSYLGDPIAIIKIDGIEVFRGAISTPHALGGQLIDLGQVSASRTHEISIEFPNDAWGDLGAGEDRNLLIDMILVNGQDIGARETLYSEGTVAFSFDPAEFGVPVPVSPPAPPSYAGDDNVVLAAASQNLAIDLRGGNDALTLAAGGNAGTVANVETLTGGAGNDVITLLAPPAGMLIDLKGGANEIRVSGNGSTLQVLNVERIQGSAGDDAITLKAAILGLTMDGGAGLDSLQMADGTNRMSLANVEKVTGGTGDDDVTLTTPAVDASIDLGLGNDRLTLANGGNVVRAAKVETIIGGTGNDIVKLQAAQVGFMIDLGGGQDELWLADGGNSGTVGNVEKIVGGTGGDQITLSTAWTAGSIDLGEGLDRLTLSSAGANTITVFNTEAVIGGSQADTVTVGAGMLNGSFDLGGGHDTVVLSNGMNFFSVANVERVIGGAGQDHLTLSASMAHTITMSDIDFVASAGGSFGDRVTLSKATLAFSIDLGGGSDTLVLGAGTNSVTTMNVELVKGNSGADTITAMGSAAVRMEGGAGNDILRGGAGNDVIYGGAGKDIMTGGAGADRFLFTSLSESATGNRDIIRDFDASMDLIAFEGVAHNGFAWRGGSAFQKNGVTQARFEERSGTLTVDIDGNGAADFALTLTGVKLADLSASDFIWG
jgi:Ca2+-binding RTX toxin-like protein